MILVFGLVVLTMYKYALLAAVAWGGGGGETEHGICVCELISCLGRAGGLLVKGLGS